MKGRARQGTKESIADTTTAPAWVGLVPLGVFILVLAAQVLLVVGKLDDDGMTWIYVSIGLSTIAGAALFVAVLRSKRSHT